MAFLEWEACHGAGLDFHKWDNNIYSQQFKAKVIEWWNLHNLVNMHITDANIPKGKKRN